MTTLLFRERVIVFHAQKVLGTLAVIVEAVGEAFTITSLVL